MEIVARYGDSAPVDLEAMARDLNVAVKYDENLGDSISGSIRREGRGFVAAVNAKHSPARQRFTLAHELAHRILHADLIGDGIVDNEMYRSKTLPDDQERQADALAVELIMPIKLVRKFFKEVIRSYGDMAGLFDVSYEAARIRMNRLRLI
jgi:Zn-dependent peptidase ImmA (M78 family)